MTPHVMHALISMHTRMTTSRTFAAWRIEFNANAPVQMSRYMKQNKFQLSKYKTLITKHRTLDS